MDGEIFLTTLVSSYDQEIKLPSSVKTIFKQLHWFVLLPVILTTKVQSNGVLLLAVLTFQKIILRNLPLVNLSLNGFVNSQKKVKMMILSCVDSLGVCSSQGMRLINLLVFSQGEKRYVSCFLNSCFWNLTSFFLDDPTNHLDLESISSLNDGVRDFKESVIFASHDHEFIQTIANHIVVVSKNGVIDRIDETYDEFLENEEVQAKVKALWLIKL